MILNAWNKFFNIHSCSELRQHLNSIESYIKSSSFNCHVFWDILLNPKPYINIKSQNY